MKMLSLETELKENAYPGRGIVIGKSKDGTKAVTAYFIMGRSENSRNRVFVEDGEGIRTQAFDPSKLTDPSLIIYAPVRVLGNKTIVTNGDQTDTIYEGMDRQLTFAGADDRRGMEFHRMILNGELPYTIGGGIGQSRLCMYFLRKAHIGEVQASVWPQEMIDKCAAHHIYLL